MIFQKQDSPEQSDVDDDEEDSGRESQDAEKFFEVKNFKFSRRWGEFRAQHFHQILSNLAVKEENEEDLNKGRKFEITGSVSSISTVLSHNDLWDSAERRSIEHHNIRNSAEKPLPSLSETTRKSANLVSERANIQLAIRRFDLDEGTISAEYEKLKTKYDRLQIQFEKMKEGHDLEIASMETAYQNKFKEMVQGKVDELRTKLEGEVRTNLGELSELKTKVSEKENFITKLNSLLTQQEKQISQLKVKMDKETFDSNLFLKKNAAPNSSTGMRELQEENDRLILEIESLKSLNEIYKKNAEIATQERLQAIKEASEERLKSQRLIQALENQLKETTETLSNKNAELSTKIEGLTAQLKDATQKYAKYKDSVDVELKILKHLDVREKKNRSANRSRGQPLRTQTPESTSSEAAYRLLTDSSKGFTGQGALPIVLRGQTPNTLSSDNTYTASKHFILNSEDFLVKGSKNKKGSNIIDFQPGRGRNFFPDRDSSGSSSSNSRSRKLASLSPYSKDKRNDLLASFVIQNKGIPDLKHNRNSSPRSYLKVGSPEGSQNPAHQLQPSYMKALDQHGNSPLKAIMESNTERDSQRSIPKEFEDPRNRFKSYKDNSLNGIKTDFGGLLVREIPSGQSTLEKNKQKPKRRYNRAPSTGSKSRSTTNQSSIDAGYGFGVQSKPISLNDSLNQTLFSFKGSTRPQTREMKKVRNDSFGLSFSIKSKNSRGESLNDSSYI